MKAFLQKLPKLYNTHLFFFFSEVTGNPPKELAMISASNIDYCWRSDHVITSLIASIVLNMTTEKKMKIFFRTEITYFPGIFICLIVSYL